MNYDELKQQRDEIQQKLDEAYTIERRYAIVTVKELTAKFQIKQKDLRVTTRKPGVIKYRNPANPDQTWTGRGKMPSWLRDMPDQAQAKVAGA